jgi:alpha-amylase
MASRISARSVLIVLGAALAGACASSAPDQGVRPSATTRAGADAARFWNGATVYFLLTDRFLNGDSTNDDALGRARDGRVLRNFEGGDLQGVLRRIEEGYFDSLGVHAIWMTPFVEQIHAGIDEGTGKTYGYHGYWTRDWTAVEPALGTADDLRAVVDAAHRHGIRVLMDAVINHTGTRTAADPPWPESWVRTTPNCTYKSYATTVDCLLVATLPDIRTESDEPVGLPPALLEKWRQEGRLDRELAELDDYFRRTGHPRAPRYYVIKWLTDWVRELGFDGYRIDTAKHFEESVSAELKQEAEAALASWRQANPAKMLDDLPFYMVGEVYGWERSHGRQYSFGDRTVNYFDHGYDALINFGFKQEASWPLDRLFSEYSTSVNTGPLHGVALLNYISSHDDGSPYDAKRQNPFGAGTRLLLAPGGAQIYYGDELARPLEVAGAEGDANLRSVMNWADLERAGATEEILQHWGKLGRFRHAHPAIGAGVHRTLQAAPYVFSRTLAGERNDRVLVAMDQPKGAKRIPVFAMFPDGAQLRDAYSGMAATVNNDTVSLATEYDLVLLEERR